MSLDQQLRRASDEIHDAVAGRRGTPASELTRRNETMRMAAAGTAAVLVVLTIGVTTLVLRGPATTAPVGSEPTTAISSPGTTTPATSVPTTALTPNQPGDDGLSGADLLPGWQESLDEDDVILLMEDGIGLAIATVTEPEPVGSCSALLVDFAPFFDVMHLLGGDSVECDVPNAMVGFAAAQDDPQVIVFGIVPSGAVEVELRWPAGSPVVFDRVFARPEVDRVVFIGTIDETELIERAPGPSEIAVIGADGSIPAFSLGESGVTIRESYTGPITADLFRIPQPLVIDSTTIDQTPEVIACNAPEGVTPPPNQGGVVTDLGIHPSPSAALAAFLTREPGDPPVADSGYLEMVEPDGSILYGIDFGDGFVTLISVIPVDDGWTVDSWEGSGC